MTGDRAGSPKVALTIAGSDSGAGAGAQADLKTFSALGVFGTTALTAVTAQNTVGVQRVSAIAPSVVGAQMDSVLSDMDVSAVKTGMLATLETLAVVAGRAAAGDLANLVVDPVIVSSSGAPLLEGCPEAIYLERLFPHALFVTPNLFETSRLVGAPVHRIDDMRQAAAELWRSGARFVVVTGGHLKGDVAADVVFDGNSHKVLEAEKIETVNVHGTGCTLSAALTAYLALGSEPMEALVLAKRYVSRAIAGGAGWRLGGGHGPLDHMGWSP